MKYISTRGQSPLVGFSAVLLTGLAPDGGPVRAAGRRPSWPRTGPDGDLLEIAPGFPI